jgi:hypothetical protein
LAHFVRISFIVRKRFPTNLVLKGLLQNGKYIENDGLSYEGEWLAVSGELWAVSKASGSSAT